MKAISRRKFFGLSGALFLTTTVPVLAAKDVIEPKKFEILKVNMSKSKREYSSMGVSIVNWEEPSKTVSFIKEEATVISIMLFNSVTQETIVKLIKVTHEVDEAFASKVVQKVIASLEAKKMLIRYNGSHESESLKVMKF